MTTYYMLFRNISSSDDTHISDVDSSLPVPTIESTGWTNEGYSFVEWNTARDKSGDSYAPGSNVPQYFESVLYAIWEEVVTPDVTISYNGDTIASLSGSGTEVLETNGTYLIDDIAVEYIKPTPNLQSKTVSPSSISMQIITADSGYDGLSQVAVNAIAPTKAAQTYTPTTTNYIIRSGRWLTGDQTIKGDANLLAENIKKGVVIFGITGTYEGGGGVSTASVTISTSGYYELILPPSASQSGNTVTLPTDAIFVIIFYDLLDMASTTGTVTRSIYGDATAFVSVCPGQDGGTITLVGGM